jgi:lipopolysaccharide/colanic/teichoic acid biosynthesis glycosyltransferase
MDVCIVLPVVAVGWPVILGVALAVRLRLGSPILFRQRRPGHRGRPFDLVKFRTMLDAVDEDGVPLPDEVRLTRLGRFLRRTSLDELPELWNVLRGEMSIVGPRPLLMEYLGLYTDRLARRHDVLPGITGWAMVNGRRVLSMQERLELDVWYVDHRSLLLDFEILGRTMQLVLSGSGAEPPLHHPPDMEWTREAERRRLQGGHPQDATTRDEHGRDGGGSA